MSIIRVYKVVNYDSALYRHITPVMFVDPLGNSIIGGLLAVAFIGAVTGAAVNGFIALVTGEDINGIAAALVSGAVSGAITSVGMVFALATGGWGGLAIAAFVGGISGASGKLMNHGMKNDWNYDDLDFSSAIMAAVNFGLGFRAGAQNSKDIGKNLWKSVSKTKVGRTFQSAATKYSTGQMSQRGFQGVMNLYGNRLAMSMTNAMPMVMANRITSSFGSIVVSGSLNAVQYGF